ncbi:MAG: hypothetical protein HDR04_05590 [Lachnospiraceae bacterium]|nr:hypothetical protein [Lachnospiraceae bacterium]
MKYTINFNLRGRENKITIDYQKIPSAQKSGFTALKIPFDVNDCIGYPMLHMDIPQNFMMLPVRI